MGSSPLARGARQGWDEATIRRGLIPARAGSTTSVYAPHGSLGAHPRSRGEHGAVCEVDTHPLGSSPLARGAQQQEIAEAAQAGLIPARAGSTPC